MVQPQRHQVLRSDGVAGVILPTHTTAEAVHVRFEDGLEVVIPRALLREERDLLKLDLAGSELAELGRGIVRVFPVVEETARADVRRVDTGGVRVSLQAEDYQTVVELPLEQVQASVTRVPLNRVLPDDAATPEPRQEGDTLIIPVVEEEVLVFKRRVLKEEVRITRSAETTVYRRPVTLRRNTVEIENLEGRPATANDHRPPTNDE